MTVYRKRIDMVLLVQKVCFRIAGSTRRQGKALMIKDTSFGLEQESYDQSNNGR